jgi:hypothetical protein
MKPIGKSFQADLLKEDLGPKSPPFSSWTYIYQANSLASPLPCQLYASKSKPGTESDITEDQT